MALGSLAPLQRPCVWVCDYSRQLSAGQDSLVYIAEGNENILTRRCLLRVQRLAGAGEPCLSQVRATLTETLGSQASKRYRNVLHWTPLRRQKLPKLSP